MSETIDPIDWITDRFDLTTSTSAADLYDRMESQSYERLPIVYEPFDASKRPHFRDRAQILDFRSVLGGGRILDFGPGDGWPSLPIAPMVEEVVGVDGSARRVEVCRANAAKLGIANASFHHVSPGDPLPFDDASFGGIAAASSAEQTPDVEATLRELRRVLKPGGKLRIHYEALAGYRGEERKEVELLDDDSPAAILLYDRHIEQECVDHYVLRLDLPPDDAARLVGGGPDHRLDASNIETVARHIAEVVTWRTRHPSCRTWLRLLAEAGFSDASPTHYGGSFARTMNKTLPVGDRPRDLNGVDEYLRPIVGAVVRLDAPPDDDPWITATA